jgi:hypothetical protein
MLACVPSGYVEWCVKRDDGRGGDSAQYDCNAISPFILAFFRRLVPSVADARTGAGAAQHCFTQRTTMQIKYNEYLAVCYFYYCLC